MAIAVSLINMKGGVGKTTLAAQLAHAADQMNFRTLAVDLDPQSFDQYLPLTKRES